MNKSRNARGSRTLPRQYYVSPEIYQLESDRIFSGQWLCVASADDVREAGSFLLVEIEGESLILARDADERVRCFYNVCRHRGALVCQQPRGSSVKSFSCPYHAWSYDLTGRLIAAPHMEECEDFSKSDYSLNAVATAIWEGIVFVNFSATPVPFKQAFEPLLGKFADWAISDLVSVKQLAYTVRANWKLLFQNYSECYHCPRVHPALNAMSAFQTASNDLLSGPFLGGPMQLADGVESMTGDGRACGRILPGLSETDRRRVYYYTLFPSVFLSPHPDYVLVHRLSRIDVETTHITCDFLFPCDVAGDARFDPTPAIEFWDQTNLQDWHVCELSQRGIASRSYAPAPYSNLESTVAEFDGHYLDLMQPT